MTPEPEQIHEWLQSLPPQNRLFMEWYQRNAHRFEPPKGRSAAITTTHYMQQALAVFDREVMRMSRREWRKKWHKSKLTR